MSESQVRKIDYNGTLTKVGYGLKLHLFLRTMPLVQCLLIRQLAKVYAIPIQLWYEWCYPSNTF